MVYSLQSYSRSNVIGKSAGDCRLLTKEILKNLIMRKTSLLLTMMLLAFLVPKAIRISTMSTGTNPMLNTVPLKLEVLTTASTLKSGRRPLVAGLVLQ